MYFGLYKVSPLEVQAVSGRLQSGAGIEECCACFLQQLPRQSKTAVLIARHPLFGVTIFGSAMGCDS